MMYGMTAYGIPGQVPGMPGQAPVMAGQAPVMPGQPGMAVPPHMASTMTTPASAHPQMNASESGVTFPPSPAINGLGGQQALMSPIAQQGSPLIMNPPVGNPYVLMQQGLGVPAMNAMNSYLGGPAARPFNNNIFGAVSGPQQNQSSEMVIPNELIGCIIGRGGAKINEIRKLSGAQIKISNCEEGSNDRKVTITGFPDTLSLATYLINTSIEIHKTQLLLATQEQAAAANPSNPASSAASATAVASNLPQPSVSQPNTQPELQAANLSSVVANTVQLQQLQQQTSAQTNGQPAQFQYGYTTVPAAALTYSVPNGLVSPYDPRTVLMPTANKLKMLPKLEKRFAPY